VVGRGTVRARGPLGVYVQRAAVETGHPPSQPISTGTLTSEPYSVQEPS